MPPTPPSPGALLDIRIDIFDACGPRGISTSSQGLAFHPGPLLDGPGTQNRPPEAEISLAKNPTICSYEYRSCGYHPRWNSPWDHGACKGCADMGATGAFGGAPYGATKRVRGVPKFVAGYTCGHRHLGHSVGLSKGHEPREGCANDDDDDDDERREREEAGVPRGAVSSKREPNTTGWLGEKNTTKQKRARADTRVHCPIQP